MSPHHNKRLMVYLRQLGCPRFHGNGIIQLYITPTKRLHIWHPDLPAFRPHNSLTHSHAFPLGSKVWYGNLQHETFEFSENALGAASMEVVQSELRVNTLGREGKSVVPLASGWLTPLDNYTFAEGSTYTMQATGIHTSMPLCGRPVVTVFTKGAITHLTAKIYTPKSELLTTAFPSYETHDERTLWDKIQDALWGCDDELVFTLMN